MLLPRVPPWLYESSRKRLASRDFARWGRRGLGSGVLYLTVRLEADLRFACCPDEEGGAGTVGVGGLDVAGVIWGEVGGEEVGLGDDLLLAEEACGGLHEVCKIDVGSDVGAADIFVEFRAEHTLVEQVAAQGAVGGSASVFAMVTVVDVEHGTSVPCGEPGAEPVGGGFRHLDAMVFGGRWIRLRGDVTPDFAEGLCGCGEVEFLPTVAVVTEDAAGEGIEEFVGVNDGVAIAGLERRREIGVKLGAAERGVAALDFAQRGGGIDEMKLGAPAQEGWEIFPDGGGERAIARAYFDEVADAVMFQGGRGPRGDGFGERGRNFCRGGEVAAGAYGGNAPRVVAVSGIMKREGHEALKGDRATSFVYEFAKGGSGIHGRESGEERIVDEAGALEERLEARVASHETSVEIIDWLGVALAEDVLAEGHAGGGIGETFLLEAGEGIGIEDFGPLVGIIASGVTGGGAEEVIEAADHARGDGFARGAVVGKDAALQGIEIGAAMILPMDVKFEVELAVGELGHAGGGAHVVFGGDHFLIDRLGDGLVGFVMSGKEIEGFAGPAEIFHDLGRKLDEIPWDVSAGEGFDLDVAKQAMEEVAKFVEDRFDFVMGEQGGFTIDGRRHVAGDETEVGLAWSGGGGRGARFELIHPSTAALGFARMPIGVKGAEVLAAALVKELVEGDFRVPCFGVFAGGSGAAFFCEGGGDLAYVDMK